MNLDEQITKAQQAKKQGLRNIALIVGCILLVLLVAWLIFVFMSKTPSITTSIETPEAEMIVQLSDHSIDLEILQTRLLQSRRNIEKFNENKALVSFSGASSAKLDATLAAAFEHYKQGEFSLAISKIDALEAEIEHTVADYEQTFEQRFKKANAHFEAKQWALSLTQANEALLLKPENALVQALVKRLQVKPKMQPLYSELEVAKLNKDFDSQIATLKKMLELEPNDATLLSELNEVIKTSKFAKFEVALSKADTAIAEEKFDVAELHVNTARQYGAEDSRLVIVQEKLRLEKRNKQLESYKDQLDVFSKMDEWESVKLVVQQALQQFPDQYELKTFEKTAVEITAAKRKLADYLIRSDRLEDETIRGQAQLFLENISPLLEKSPSLMADSNAVLTLLEKKHADIAVRIKSDNRSTLRVLGVGNIGIVTSKTIKLKPGRYQFEAKRTGYKTKVIDVDVYQSILPLEVTLYCEEKI
ncbi:hypothetical protein PALB_24980 [Pseudoalteromonas luteoviolacea B = ATCC 29581]|nr:hypothetical protein PALB_24980 [Pseudoalteromonas luteoviolacea B = ATCC 29581]